ncbi:MAG: FAD-binding protein [Nitrospirae bacterium]|nr:MAG: FAD-binding protein [Nitrospirota bacterium]
MRRSSSTRRTYDVIIVGMGPAGASAALELSLAGLSVLALEKETHPRYKVCGGGLSARIASFLPEDFSITVERIVSRVHFLYGCAEPFVIEQSCPIAYMVMRDTFDRWLVEKARQAGAVIREEEPVESLQVESSGVEIVSARERYEGQVLIGADGATGVVARQVFPHRRRRTIPAVEGELALDDAIDARTGETAVIRLSAVKKGVWMDFSQERRAIHRGR